MGKYKNDEFRCQENTAITYGQRRNIVDLVGCPLIGASLCLLLFAIITAMVFGRTEDGMLIGCGNAMLSTPSREVGNRVLGIRLALGEWVRFILDSRNGLLVLPPNAKDFLVITNLRLISVVRDGDSLRESMAPIAMVTSVTITTLLKPLRPLILAGLTLIGAAAIFLGMATIGWSGLLPWIIGGVLLALTGLNASGYFFPDGTSSLSFSLGTTEVTLPLYSDSSLIDGRYVASEVLNIAT